VYQVILSPKSEKFLKKIKRSDSLLFGQFIDAIDSIANNPYSGKALLGNLKGYWSYRLRDYRIIYEIEDKRLLVFIEKIAHRRESYK